MRVRATSGGNTATFHPATQWLQIKTYRLFILWLKPGKVKCGESVTTAVVNSQFFVPEEGGHFYD